MFLYRVEVHSRCQIDGSSNNLDIYREFYGELSRNLFLSCRGLQEVRENVTL